MSGAQRYIDVTARLRMANNQCPECGTAVEEHSGWGGPGCTLTDNGVAQRINQFRKDRAASMDISDRWYPR